MFKRAQFLAEAVARSERDGAFGDCGEDTTPPKRIKISEYSGSSLVSHRLFSQATRAHEHTDRPFNNVNE